MSETNLENEGYQGNQRQVSLQIESMKINKETGEKEGKLLTK